MDLHQPQTAVSEKNPEISQAQKPPGDFYASSEAKKYSEFVLTLLVLAAVVALIV